LTEDIVVPLIDPKVLETVELKLIPSTAAGVAPAIEPNVVAAVAVKLNPACVAF
jgi:hypothetical protein